MTTLARNIRKDLENTVKKARRVAEIGSRKVLEQLAVHHHEPWPSMTPEQRVLRNRLRAHGRQLGDQRDTVRGIQTINHLMTECAYEQWHRMLFARFLAEADLLIEPESGMPLTLDECQELAREQATDWLELASTYAERMLPQIFRSGDPVLEVGLPPETRSELEDLLKALPSEVFLADDSLGWVYQFWQADRKEEVNKSGIKIGADELPAVTQLFTEDYMVYFLLHNTLGAWWAGKVLANKPELATSATSEAELRASCSVGDIEWDYLRFVQDDDGSWRPAAGTFDGWPKVAREIKLLDPSMGSGHFLVFALPIMVALRMAEEGLSRESAVTAILRDNIYGLEIDPRCTQIAAFNLAFAAWRQVGFRALPPLHLACSGLSLGVSKSEWLKLAEQVSANLPVPPDRDLFGSKDNLFSARVKSGLESLYDLFAKAPSLGSLIDPRKAAGNLFEAGFYELEPLLASLLAKHDGDEIEEMAVAAQGLAKAAELLTRVYTLVATNVPFLTILKHSDDVLAYGEAMFPAAKNDLATMMLDRWYRNAVSTATVSPHQWMFQVKHTSFRKKLLYKYRINLISDIGEGGFQTSSAAGAFVCLAITSIDSEKTTETSFSTVDVKAPKNPDEKSMMLLVAPIGEVSQKRCFEAKSHTITLVNISSGPTLGDYAYCLQGTSTGDNDRYLQFFWEHPTLDNGWVPFLMPPESNGDALSGSHSIINWSQLSRDGNPAIRGEKAWGNRGIIFGKMRSLPFTVYYGHYFSNSAPVVIPQDDRDLPAIWAFTASGELERELRKLNPAVAIENGYLGKIPFDMAYWSKKAQTDASLMPPKFRENKLDSWGYSGDVAGTEPLLAGVAILVGYSWPLQTGFTFVQAATPSSNGLEKHIDDDGIVCLNPLHGEPPAAERLNALLANVYGTEWSAAKQSSLLTEVGYAGKSLDDWLRDGFFSQHCELFHHCPFIWHIWDGRRDGFHALVNYHLLAAPDGEGRRTLDKLIYTYLGDWIDGQRRDQAAGVEGADARLVAAEYLKAELEKIRNGEPPYDIFVRWKSLHNQPIGWEPDINDGVRVNIRPFMTAKPYGAKAANACILRTTPKNLKWDKDRGKELERKREYFPWFWGWDEQTENFAGGKEFDGNRWNDLHYTTEFKRAARERQGS